MEMWRWYRGRFVGALALALLITAGVAYLLFAPAYIMLTAPVGDASVSSASDQDRAMMQNMQRTAAIVTSVGVVATSSQALFAAISAALAPRPSGIAVTGVQYLASAASSQAGKHTLGSLVITGHAATPDRVNAYASALRADTHFTAVSVPIGASAGSADGSFTMTLTGTF